MMRQFKYDIFPLTKEHKKFLVDNTETFRDMTDIVDYLEYCDFFTWFDYDNDMEKLSKAFPEVKFDIEIIEEDGEKSRDLWINGEKGQFEVRSLYLNKHIVKGQSYDLSQIDHEKVLWLDYKVDCESLLHTDKWEFISYNVADDFTITYEFDNGEYRIRLEETNTINIKIVSNEL